MQNKIIEKDLSYKIVGVLYKAHQRLGRYCNEKQYGDLIAEKLQQTNINFVRESPIVVSGRKSSFVDFLIENKLVLELKCKPFIEKNDYYQTKRYLELLNLELGLLVNFRQKYLYPKRILNGQYSEHSDKFVVKDYFNVNGFTLMELTVAMGVFAAAMAFATGAFVQALKTQRVVNHLMSVNSNASLALEQIAREVRTGYVFEPTPSAGVCGGGDGFVNLKFINHKRETVVYRLNGTTMEKGVCAKDADCSSFPTNFTFNQMTAANVSISDVCFVKTQLTLCDPWRITIGFRVGSARPELASNAMNVQTTVSARILPYEVPSYAAANGCN